ncbi:response regulator transcription factor [Pigmentiphaga aceris]|uniref:Response regulator transcription factor n=1 Tax=Pigmentiphaga aceris TaxID=1940612 RepID=A0A5C0AZK2_9BURK|nr:response regulator transcription factor [Pigmentiphaga aceris]QEI06853.1 response regulator transcription factor [Pigmentiphaga aceris]
MNAQTSLDATLASEQALIFIVDDEAAVRDSLDSLFRSVGFRTTLFGSASELLQVAMPNVPACIILDVRLPGISGLDFQDQLTRQGIDLPIVFMTGHGDIPMTVRAMKAGAVDFLSKPFREQDMLDAVAAAIERDRQQRAQSAAMLDLRARHETLTPREREVLAHVVSGLMNKQVAGLLGLSEITVKIHRGNVMRKMGVRSLADLVRQAQALGVSAP